MYLDGKGTEQIAIALTADKILNPTHYWRSKGVKRGGLKADKDNCIGAIDIPEALTMPEIAMQTRRGVTVAYAPLQNAG